MSIITVLVIGSTSLMGSSADATLKAQRRDAAAAAAFTLLEYAESGGCGLTVGNPADRLDFTQLGEIIYSPRLLEMAERCFESLGYVESIAYDPLNEALDAVPEICDGQTYICSFDVHFDWPRTPSTTVFANDGVCPAYYDNGTTLALRENQPTILVRTVTISWTEDGGQISRTYSTRETINPDSPAYQTFGTSNDLGYFIYEGSEGTSVSFTVNPVAVPDAYLHQIIRRVPPGHSCVVFPFLSAGASVAVASGGDGGSFDKAVTHNTAES